MQVNNEAVSRFVRARSLPPVKAYRSAVFDDVLARFSLANLEHRASEAAQGEFGARTPFEDQSDAGEAAREQGQVTFDTLFLVRQGLLNLLATGLFHLVEQQLGDVCRYVADGVPEPRDTKPGDVAKRFKDHLRLTLQSLPSWSKVDELHLVANVVKHGAGRSEQKLRLRRPVLFQDPEKLAYWGGVLEDDDFASTYVHTPLAGVDLYVTEEILNEYFDAAESFFDEVANSFHGEGVNPNNAY